MIAQAEVGDSIATEGLITQPRRIYTPLAFLRSADSNTSTSVIFNWSQECHRDIIPGNINKRVSGFRECESPSTGRHEEWITTYRPDALNTYRVHNASCHRRPRLTTLRFASPNEPNTFVPAPFPPTAPAFLASEEKALLTTGMLSRRIHPPFDFSRSCGGRRRDVSGVAA